jgi:hypothetical protein
MIKYKLSIAAADAECNFLLLPIEKLANIVGPYPEILPDPEPDLLLEGSGSGCISENGYEHSQKQDEKG